MWLLAAVAATALSSAPTASVERFSAARTRTEQLVSDEVAPSIAVAVFHRGQIVDEWAVGYADRQAAVRATPSTIYAVASVSKSITAAAVMRLAEQGRISLDRPIGRYLRSVRIRTPIGDPARLTVRSLLNMTGGVPHLVLFRWRDGGPYASDLEIYRRRAFTAFPPGELFHYSNLSFALLGQMIEDVTQLPFGTFIERELFQPLGLSHSRLRLSAAQQGEAAKPYAADGSQPVDFERLMPDGGAWFLTSAHDLASWGGHC